MPNKTKTTVFTHELAGRLELGRKGDIITYPVLASQYSCSERFIVTLRSKTKDTYDEFRLLAIESAEKYLDSKGIEVSAGSVRAYLQRRQLPGCTAVESAVRAQEDRVQDVLVKFQSVPIIYQNAKKIIADTVRRLALKPIDAETVMAALEDMGRALDQLEPSSSNDQRGMAPREFH
jgi:hypothetical protein